MSTAKVKQKKVGTRDMLRKLGITNDGGMKEIFKSMLGMNGGSPEIIHDRTFAYQKLLHDEMKCFITFGCIAKKQGLSYSDEILEHAKNVQKRFKEAFSYISDPMFPSKNQLVMFRYNKEQAEITSEHIDFLRKHYGQMRDSVVRTAVENYRNIVQERNKIDPLYDLFSSMDEKAYEDIKRTLKGIFISSEYPAGFHPIVGCEKFDVREMIDLDDTTLETCDDGFCFHFLKFYFIESYITKERMMPEVDKEDFILAMRFSLEQLKLKLPECSEAFKMIENSIDLFRDNYEDYHKSGLTGGSATAILENFVGDVQKNTNAKPRVVKQFMKIMEHFTEAFKEMRNDPKFAGMDSEMFDNFEETLGTLYQQLS